MYAQYLDPSEYDLVESVMLEDTTPGSQRATLAESFSSAIGRVFPSKPEAYLLTARSAVPLADTIRGYYDALDQDIPPLHYVRANTTTSRDDRQREITIEREVSRLNVIKGIGSVCVIDQWKYSGRSLKMAHDIATRLEIRAVHLIAGSWYSETYRDDVNLEYMTSAHSELMYSIGQRAAYASISKA